jgi:hypothetical protein
VKIVIPLLIIFCLSFPENSSLDRLDPRLYPEPDSLSNSGAEPCCALDYDETKFTLYCAEGDRVLVYDVLNPKKPATISRSIELGGRVYDVDLRSNLLFIAGGKSGLDIWDVSDPGRLRALSSFPTRSTALAVCVSDSTAFIADADSGMIIVDVSDPREPCELGNLNFSGLALDVWVSGRYAYVADYDSGLRIISIEDPAAPFETGRLASPGHPVGIQVSGNLGYLAELEGLRIINVKDPKKPVEIEFYKTPDIARSVFVIYPYSYLACGKAGLRIINVSDPLRPFEAAFFYTPDRALSLKIYGHYAYIGMEHGFNILDKDSMSGNFRYILPVMLFVFTVVGFKVLF